MSDSTNDGSRTLPFELIRATVRRLARPLSGKPSGADEPPIAEETDGGSPEAPRAEPEASRIEVERLMQALRARHGIADDDGPRAAEEVGDLLGRLPATRYAALLARPELARPAVALALGARTRRAIAEGSPEAPELARLALATASRFSGEHYAASAILDRLGEGWLLLAFAHLARRELSAAQVAYDVAAAILVQAAEGSGDADLQAELLLAEGLLELAGGGWENALHSLQEAVHAYATLGETGRARAAAHLLAEASLGRPTLAATHLLAGSPREITNEHRPARGALSHVLAAWRALRSSTSAITESKESE